MIVAGAGIIGLTCAWRLAQRGVPVTVFDAGDAGREASWAGAGMLAPGGEIETASRLADLSLRSLRLYPSFIRELEEESRVSIDYRECGAVEIAFTSEEADALTARAARQETLGILSEPCLYKGRPARFYPGDAVVNPRDVTEALSTACRQRGVILREREAVLSVREDATVFTARGECRDDAVLIAAGAWSSDLMPRLPRSVPVRGHLLSFDVGDAPGPILRNGHTYLLQRRSGLLIAGSSTEYAGFDRSIDPRTADDIHLRAAALFPALSTMRPLETWIGFRPGIESGEPLIGRVANSKVWTAFGHYRNGILLAPETARLIADSVRSRA